MNEHLILVLLDLVHSLNPLNVNLWNFFKFLLFRPKAGE